ncbi:MAG: acetylornithine transaminase [Rhodospirillales bacterium]|nr:acetylornithine transaminase [Rhodospirillales bacterium]
MTSIAEHLTDGTAHGSYGALMEITQRPPITFTRGRGGWLWDSDGNRYLDFVQGWAVNCLGHCPPAIAHVLAEQSTRLLTCSPAYYSEPLTRYASALTAAAGLDRVFFANSGAEANEGAIKLARKWGARYRGGAHEIITTVHGFHGRTLATMSASGKAAWDGLFEPKVAGFPKVPVNDLGAMEAAITDRTVAIMLEPIQGEAGVWPADDEYLRALRSLADQREILLILDEIQTGMGRTGALFCFEHAGVRPDILTLGKGIGAGTPLAALLAREQVCCFEPGDQGGTFNGNALMAAVGNAVLEQLTAEGFLDRVRNAGGTLRRGLEALSENHGLGGVRGRGLLLALDLRPRTDGFALVEAALANRLLLNAPAADALRFMPALNVSDVEIAEMLDMLDRLLKGA